MRNNKTDRLDLMRLHTKISSNLLHSKINANVQLSINVMETEPLVVGITFFHDNKMDNFTMNIYQFWSRKKNDEIYELSLQLMQDHSLYSEIKEQFKNLQFGGK